MPRSQKKGPYVNPGVYANVMKARDAGTNGPVKVWSRSCTIVPEFVGINFDIHNGKTFVRLFVTEDMVGHKLGEFSPTRSFRSHTQKK